MNELLPVARGGRAISADIRIELRFRNNLIKARMEAAGIRSNAELARISGERATVVGDLINMRISPCKHDSRTGGVVGWKKSAERIAAALKVTPDMLFSERQLEAVGDGEPKHVLIDSARVSELFVSDAAVRLSPNTPEDILLEQEKREQVDGALETALETLTPRQEAVLRMRFGMNDEERNYSFEEVAEVFDVSRERVRQIEGKALRKLREPGNPIRRLRT